MAEKRNGTLQKTLGLMPRQRDQHENVGLNTQKEAKTSRGYSSRVEPNDGKENAPSWFIENKLHFLQHENPRRFLELDPE